MTTRTGLVLLVGGQKSGKSGLAQRTATSLDLPVVVVAPARAGDPEMAERIAIHRQDRPGDWTTVESFDLLATLHDAADEATVVVDALDTWLVEEMTTRGLWVDDDVAPWGGRDRAEADEVVATARAVARVAATRSGSTLVIAGQPGLGPVAMGAAARRYVDLHGRVLQAVSGVADRVVLVVAGRALDLPAGDLLRPLDAPGTT